MSSTFLSERCERCATILCGLCCHGVCCRRSQPQPQQQPLLQPPPSYVGGFFTHLLHRVFVDLRYISCLMCAWLGVVIFLMTEIGIFANPAFVAFGPRPTLTFMHVSVDTGYKYGVLVALIIMHTLVSDFISDSLTPHVINTLQDLRTRHIPHRPQVYYAITTLWALYSAVSQLILIFLALGQLDLLIVRLLSDMLANFVTTGLYLRNKTYDPRLNHSSDRDDALLLSSPCPSQQHDDARDDADDADKGRSARKGEEGI